MLFERTQSKIWLGACDNCIYVVDIHSKAIDMKLDNHTDVIVSLVADKELVKALNNFNSLFKLNLFKGAFSRLPLLVRSFYGI